MLRRLVASADVLVENFRPGVMDRLGLGYDELREVNPALVYCAITGFGQDGPMKDAPAYDQIIQGLSGMMSITGDERSAPLRVGLSGRRHHRRHHRGVRDRRARWCGRQRTGEGAFIDVSMLDSTIVDDGLGRLELPDRRAASRSRCGNDNFTAAPSGTFRTGDGLLNIAANKQEQFEALARGARARRTWSRIRASPSARRASATARR